MAAETYRDIMNQTLRSIRAEERIAAGTTELSDDGTDTYEVLVFEMVADAIEQLQDEWTWTVYQERQTLTYTANADSVALGAALTEKAELLIGEDGRPLAWDVTDSSNPVRLESMTAKEMLIALEEDTTNRGSPSYITITTDGDTPSVRLYPVPSSNVSLSFWVYNPPERPSPTTASVLDTTVKLPARALRALCRYWASQERGEELGTPLSILQMRAQDAIADAKALDMARQGSTGYGPVDGYVR